MATVNIGQAKTELSRLVALALAGEDVEIARDGVPPRALSEPLTHGHTYDHESIDDLG